MLNLSTDAAITNATARASELRVRIRAGEILDAADPAWLADIAVAALALTEPSDLDLARYLSALDEVLALPEPLPEPPAWLRLMQEDFNVQP